MEFAFYICGLIAILATLRVITHTNPVHALLYLIISLLAISGVFFSLGAYFAGALEIIVYAGAIMVLFVFVVMMLNLGGSEIELGVNALMRPRPDIVVEVFATAASTSASLQPHTLLATFARRLIAIPPVRTMGKMIAIANIQQC